MSKFISAVILGLFWGWLSFLAIKRFNYDIACGVGFMIALVQFGATMDGVSLEDKFKDLIK